METETQTAPEEKVENPQAAPSEDVPAPGVTPEVIEEAMFPDLSADYFTWEGKQIPIQVLKWSNQKKFAKTIHPVAEDMAMHFTNAPNYMAMTNIIAHIEVIPKLIQILADDAGMPISNESMEDARIPIEDMFLILVQFSMKNQKIGKPIHDFFTRAWPLVMRKIERESSGALDMLVEEERLIEMKKKLKTLAPTAPLSSDSVSDTAGQ